MTEMEKLRRAAVKYKQLYPAGTRIVLEYMHNDINPVPTGTMGTITDIDNISNIYVKWDNGRTLSICPQVDKFRTLTEEEKAFDQSLIDFIAKEIPNIKHEFDDVTFNLPGGQYKLIIFASEIDDVMCYVIEPNEIRDRKQIQIGFSGCCEFGDTNALLQECRYAIATTFPNSCRCGNIT